MKKIWPWLLLLLLLIIFCVWSKKDSIHVSSNTHNQSVTSTPVVVEEHYIEYVIQQKNDTDYTLNGNFTNTQQQSLMADTFTHANRKLTIDKTATNETLKDTGIITLTNKILPHFMETYKNGKMVYNNQKLTISGTATSYEAQHQMQALLNSSTIASQDNSNVAMEAAPITYQIDKKPNSVHAVGTFGDNTQISSIKQHLAKDTSTNFKIKAHSKDKGSLPVVDKFLPFFLEKYTTGKIDYSDEKLSISGNVHSQDELEEAKQLLANAGIPVINHTQVDPEILANAKAAAEKARLEEEAKKAEAEKLAALEAQKKAEAEAAEKARLEEEAKKAEAEKLAALEAQKKAEAEAAEKARLEEEAKKAEAAKLAALEAQKKAEAEAAKKEELKNKIANLFKLENIEFNVNKSTLTQKGQNTVNKLAAILDEYTSVNIEIAGHTDSDGSATYNQKLSQSRVDTVKSKLVGKGINASRLTAKGYGETKPLVPNTTRANKAKNRRVEINILGE